MKSVFLAGEGRNDLGGWARQRPWRDEDPEPGVLEALMRRVVPDGWRIREACVWKNIPSLVVGGGRLRAEERNVRAVAQFAIEHACDVLVFARDRDRDEARGDAIAKGLAHARERHAERLAIAGAVAIECLEAWVLAAEGKRRTESRSVGAVKRYLGAENATADMVARIGACPPEALADDASSLRAWCEEVRAALGGPDQGRP